MEFGTLTKHTGNDTYRQLAEASVKAVINAPAPLPGLAAQGIDPSTGAPVGGYVVSVLVYVSIFNDANYDKTWGGGSDSYFEYLIKYPRLTNTNDTAFVDTWKLAVDTSIKTLIKVGFCTFCVFQACR